MHHSQVLLACWSAGFLFESLTGQSSGALVSAVIIQGHQLCIFVGSNLGEEVAGILIVSIGHNQPASVAGASADGLQIEEVASCTGQTSPESNSRLPVACSGKMKPFLIGQGQ